MPVLYLVACGAPPAAELAAGVGRFQEDGWTVCVIATPMALRFFDAAAVAAVAGFPVRSEYRQPGEVDPFPPANAVVVAPATFNTINKWAAGMSDTLALGVLNELLCSEVPILAAVWAKEQLREHPAYSPSVHVLLGEGVRFVGPGSGPTDFPWEDLAAALPGRA